MPGMQDDKPSRPQSGMVMVSGWNDDGSVTVRESGGRKFTIPSDLLHIADLPPTQAQPEGSHRFFIFTPEQLEKTKGMSEAAKEAYKAKFAAKCWAGHDAGMAKKTTEEIDAAEALRLKEESEARAWIKKNKQPAGAPHSKPDKSQGTKQDVKEGDAYNKQFGVAVLVGFDNNGGAIMRHADGTDVVHPEGTYVLKDMPPTPEMPQGFFDVIFLPSDVLKATKHMTEKHRAAYHQVFAEHGWAKLAASTTKEQVKIQMQQMRAMGSISEEVKAKAASEKAAEAAKGTKRE